MKKGNQLLLGIILILVGLVLGLNALGITEIELFFDGWWTLFIIVPCVMGLTSGNDRTGNLIGLCIGVFLLLCCQNILDFDMLWKLALPAIILIFGIKMIMGSLWDKGATEAMKNIPNENAGMRSSAAVFSGENITYSGEVFHGAELNAIFGGLRLDLRNAIIEQDCVINASAIFGGIDIFVPDNVNIKVSSTSIFGGVSNKASNQRNEAFPTIYLKGTCLFGGVDIK